MVSHCLPAQFGTSQPDAPSHCSGSFAAARSSIENLTSTPFSRRDSGSAFISQYERPVSSRGVLSRTGSCVVPSSPNGFLFLESMSAASSSAGMLLRGRPRPLFGVVDGGATSACKETGSVPYRVVCCLRKGPGPTPTWIFAWTAAAVFLLRFRRGCIGCCG